MSKTMIAAALAGCSLMFGAAEALTLNVTPATANIGQNITVSVSNLAPYLAVAYTYSDDGGRTWHWLDAAGKTTTNPASVLICRQEPCRFVFPSPRAETAIIFRVAVVDPHTRQWIYGSRTNQLVSWNAGPKGGSDYKADFNWNRDLGGFVVQVGSGYGNLVGNFQSWMYTGRLSNGGTVECSGGLDSGRAPGPDAPGTVKCRAVWGSPQNVWECHGPGRMLNSWTAYAGGIAWFGSGACDGTISQNGKVVEKRRFGPVYIRSNLGT